MSTVCICPLFTFIHALPKYHSVNAFSLLAHLCVFLCVHCQFCVSTVCICPLFTFTHYLSSTQSMRSLCWPIIVCPQSVVCVHGLYMSTVRFHTHTAELARRQCLLSAGQFLCVHCQWCVSTVCICPLFTFIHTPLTVDTQEWASREKALTVC